MAAGLNAAFVGMQQFDVVRFPLSFGLLLILIAGCDGGGSTTFNGPGSADTAAPTVPQNLEAVAASTSQIDLSWNASIDSGGSGLAGYRIYRDGNPNPVGNSANTSFSDGGLTADTSYSHTVSAFDGAGNESAESAMVNMTTRFPNVAAQRVFDQVSFSSPTAMLQAPGDSARWFVVEQAGLVRVFDNDQSVAQSDVDVFVDITARVTSGGERGLLGMAFHADFATNNQVYLSYTGGATLTSFVSRFVFDPVSGNLDASSEAIILTVPQDFSNHNGGDIAFGPSGYLFVGFGDGGSGGDPNDRAQDTTNILGSMVRIDIDSASPYAIPPTNPFSSNPNCVNGTGAMSCPEIYAWGLRNPWRFSFDSQTGELWVGDVGQYAWEEIDRMELGMNYGWDDREGAHCFEPTVGCSTNSVDPITEYDHSVGNSVTGGYVYRGSAIPELGGYYVFADFGSGRIWAIPSSSQQGVAPLEVIDTSLSISSFAQGLNGELYVLDYGGGGIYQIVDNS